MLTMRSLLLHLLQRPLVFLAILLLQLHPSLAYSLTNCIIDYSENPMADVFLDCSNQQLVIIPDDIPRDARSIKLSHNQLKKIDRKDFCKYSKLRILYLHFNDITQVEDGAFIHLGELVTLDMKKNQLTNLTARGFQGLSNLTMLDLSYNNIQFIHMSAFQSLISLQTLILFDNQLQQITDIEPILQLPNLQKLDIGQNLFPSFDTKDLMLNISSSLKVLHVSNNKFENFSISTPIFPYLEMLQISRCGETRGLKWLIPYVTLLSNITQLYFSDSLIHFADIQKVFLSLRSLIYLTLTNMPNVINKGLLSTVCKIPTLRKLDLFSNKVPDISKTLVSCSQLTELDLSLTTMTELYKGSMQSMKQLKSLNAENNFLTKVPDDIKSLTSLEILSLGNNVISKLGCEDFINSTRLTELYLNTNHIFKLDRCVFENLNHLKVLDLSYNMLYTFGGVFKIGPQTLEVLKLDKNFVTLIEKGDFQGLGSLKYLDVSKNTVRLKHMAFVGLNNLEALSVSLPSEVYDNFRGLQQLITLTIYISLDSSLKHPDQNYYEDFYHLKSLKSFTVVCSSDHFGFPLDVPMKTLQSMTYLESFTAENIYIFAPTPDTFQFNTRLKNLTISQSDLSDLDPLLFQPISNLQVLDFSNCNLKSLDFLTQANLSALRYLILRDNDITVINETIFQPLHALTYLDLGNNPFTCDCSNAGFIQWVMTNNQTQVVNAHQYTCSFPVTEQGKNLLDFDISYCWMNISFLCFISSTCLVLLTLLSCFIYHFLRWQLVYAFYLFQAFLYDGNKRKKGSLYQYDAFISYNIHDEAWVYREMLPVLEEEQGWRLCLHHRDFQPGKPIMENITDAIYSSRKTICVITRDYLQSEWCSREIQMASFRLFDEQKDVLILLFLEEIPAWQLSPYYRMRKLVMRRTYLSWPQAGQHTGVFWENVRRALETQEAPTEINLLIEPGQY